MKELKCGQCEYIIPKLKRRCKRRANCKLMSTSFCWQHLTNSYFWIGTDYKVKSSCMKQFSTDKATLLGKGSMGQVYSFSKHPRFILKVLPLNVNIPSGDCDPSDPTTLRDCLQTEEYQFAKEAKIATRAGNIGVGPKVHGYWICDIEDSPFLQIPTGQSVIAGFIVSDKMDITVNNYKKLYPAEYKLYQDKIKEMFLEKLVKLLEAGYIERDTHGDNVMMNIDPKTKQPIDVKIVDFGETVKATPGYDPNNLIKFLKHI